jgi:uncharacterized protein (DUF2252 family)
MRDILDSIRTFNNDRITTLKYAAMAQSPFRFFRGTCHLFYEDYSKASQVDDPTRSWICGDLHLENFGSYRGDNHVVYFDMNDFDEAVLAPVTWEISRLLTSIHVAIHTMMLPAAEGDRLAMQCLRQYMDILMAGKATVMEPETAQGLLKTFFRQAARRSRKDLLRSRTIEGSKPLRLRCDGTHALLLPPRTRKLHIDFFKEWCEKKEHEVSSYRVLDVARRIAGTGSLGLDRYVLLVSLPDSPGKLRLLDMKEARSSSLLPWLSQAQPQWKTEAQRVVVTQKRVQHVSPALLRTLIYEGRSFIIRELQPIEDKMDLGKCGGQLQKLAQIMDSMAVIAASGQIRSGGQQGSSITDELKSFSHDKTWQKEVLKFAKSYSRQVLKDYASFRIAYAKGEMGNKIRKNKNTRA